MIKRLLVGVWAAHADVKKAKYSYGVVIVIPFGSKAYAESCLEGLGNGEKITERKVEGNG